jgi:hypothetical protein
MISKFRIAIMEGLRIKTVRNSAPVLLNEI